jgi:hypothetical protein
MKTHSITDALASVADKAALGEAVLDLVRNTGLLKPRKRRARSVTAAVPKRKRSKARTRTPRKGGNSVTESTTND